MTNKLIEVPKANTPWELQPIGEIKCILHCCRITEVKDKNSCNYHACPYSNDGDDGYF